MGTRNIKAEEVRRMLKDHGVDFQMVSRPELSQMVRAINEFTSLDDQALEFDGFIQLIVQLAIFCHQN